jgi:arsenite methyltransferase
METKLTIEDRKRIKEAIHQKYAKVSSNPEGHSRYPTGRAGLEALNYDPEIIKALPEAAVASYCGVGNPFTLGPVHEGELVLDIGCGCGVDTLIAAIMVGRRASGKSRGHRHDPRDAWPCEEEFPGDVSKECHLSGDLR